MAQVGVYLDTSNIYYCVREMYKKKVDYTKLINFLNPIGGGDLKIKKSFSAQFGKQANGFLARLKKLDFETFCKEPKVINTKHGLKHKADWDVGMCLEIIQDIEAYEIDSIILCTADSDFAPLVKYLKDRKIKVYVVACNISTELKEAVDEWIEIPEMLLL